MRRHIVPTLMSDFDYRLRTLEMEIGDDWDSEVKARHQQNKNQVIESYKREFGAEFFDKKLENIKVLGVPPNSILSYHNVFLRQTRSAFVHGYYYPALVAACALGERVLNHLILDLRDSFKNTPEYQKVANRAQINNWQKAVHVLRRWAAIREETSDEFLGLEKIRLRSIHYSESTYDNLRDDAISAIKRLSNIVDLQFSSFGMCPWFITSTAGACFIKQEYETDPFVRTFYLRYCPPVGIYHQYGRVENSFGLFDYKLYPDQKVSDTEFSEMYNDRDISKLAPVHFPHGEDILCYRWR